MGLVRGSVDHIFAHCLELKAHHDAFVAAHGKDAWVSIRHDIIWDVRKGKSGEPHATRGNPRESQLPFEAPYIRMYIDFEAVRH